MGDNNYGNVDSLHNETSGGPCLPETCIYIGWRYQPPYFTATTQQIADNTPPPPPSPPQHLSLPPVPNTVTIYETVV